VHQRVLIVEDEVIVADDLAWKLRQLGYDVVGFADSGEDAISIADQSRPDIVLMDVQLRDGTSGIESARIIQERTGAAMVFVSAFAGLFLQDRALMLKSGICLGKPFSLLQLKTALETLTARDQA
jgi:DNA-binding response OmpR family regulator